MKVLFVFFTDPPRPFSTSVAALSAVARAAGHEVDALELWRKSAIADAVDAIERRGPDVIALSAMTRDWPGASALLSMQRTGAFVVVGGYHATLASRDVAACDPVDAICIGEGERPLAALLEALGRARPKASTPGLWVRGPEGWQGAPPAAAPEPDIGRLLPWDYDVFGDVRAMLRAGVNTFGPHVDGFLPTRASRGCPFTCAYCSAPAWGKVGGLSNAAMVNTRPVAQLCDELASLRERYAPEGFEFWDEHFPISIGWLDELAREYPRRVGLPFKVEMHPSAASCARLERLAEAGCVLFHCGVEAGDETLRREVLNRRTRDAELARVFEDCRALGIATSASVMTMLPGETRAEMRSTASLLKRLRPDSFMWSTYQPLPSTPLGDAAIEAWPAPARARFDDHPPYASRTPPRVSEREREETFEELALLQAQRIEDPSRARPVEIPIPVGEVPPRLAALLGRSDVTRARWEGDTLRLSLGSGEVELGPNDGSPCYRATDRLRLSYRGAHATPALRAALDALAARCAHLGVDDLARACGAPFTAERHARGLIERGYTILERTHDDPAIAAIRARLRAIHAGQGSPAPYAARAVELTPELMLNPTGFVIFQLLGLAPELAPLLLTPDVVETARAALGPDMSLELTGAVISDARRPFFSWHNHIGGIDVEAVRARGEHPRFARSERLIAVLYLDDVDDEGGPLLALPRRIDEPTAPQRDLRAQRWDGEVELTFPRGSTLIFEQCTWHAVRPQRRAGLRMFVGCYFTSREAPPTIAVDRSLRGFEGGGALLQSVLPR